VGMIPLFIVVVTVVVPVTLARQKSPKRSLRRLYLAIALLALVWALLCVGVYPHYVFPE
jgi:hypothetical protein